MYRAVVLGVDGLNPEMLRRWLDDLPSLKKIQQEGIWGELESTIPPTAPQAWISSQCGQNPGAYGLWDYTYRGDFSYGESELADSKTIDDRVDCLYRILPRMGQKVALTNAPLTWPPPEIPGGYCISNLVPQNKEISFTWPKSLKDDVNKLLEDYIFDPFDTQRDSKLTETDRVVERIHDMDSQRLSLVRNFIHEKNCDYVFAVLTGAKLILRLLWGKSGQNDSLAHYQDVLREYYKWIDANIGEICKGLDSETVLFLYSPYSTEKAEGGINLNEWLIHNGYLTLDKYPEKPAVFKDLNVDWTKTRCWSMGKSGKLYVNLKGRETQGIVEPDDYDKLLDELADKISDIHDENGTALDPYVFKRDETHFGRYEEYGPDLFIQIEKVPWNTNDWVGYGLGVICSSDQREEPDSEYHGRYGYFCLSGSDVPAIGELRDISVLNMAPTVMEILRLEIPVHMEKPSILSMAKEKQKKSCVSRKERVRSRLKALGY